MLIIAHPGHELRVYGWMTAVKPRVAILTDGSGSTRESRLASSYNVVTDVGAAPSSLFGAVSDRQLYDLILQGANRPAEFLRLIENLICEFVNQHIDYVVGDAVEGINTGHDILRELINIAVYVASARLNRSIAKFDLHMYARPDEHACSTVDLRLRLSPDLLEQKLRVAHGYRELRDEVADALNRYGRGVFAEEQFRWLDAKKETVPLEIPPFYERYGALRVKEGAYQTLITYAHIRDLNQHLWQLALESIPSLPHVG